MRAKSSVPLGDVKKALCEILREPGLFEELLNFFAKIVEVGTYDLVVFIARKAWALFKVFEPFIDGEKPFSHVTHDKMILPWLAVHGTPAKIAVVDDTLLRGSALRDCIDRLHNNYGLSKSSVNIHVFAANRPYSLSDLFDSEGRFAAGGGLSAGWVYDYFYHSELEVRKYSHLFVKAIHAANMPYVAYIPAFRFPLSTAVGTLFSRMPHASDVQDCLSEKLNDWTFRDITVEVQNSHTLSFCLFPPVNYHMDGRPRPGAEVFSAMRFYVNFELGSVLFVPYVGLESHSTRGDIRAHIPEQLKALCLRDDIVDSRTDNKFIGQQTAHRLLKYASAYKMGRSLLIDTINMPADEIEQVSSGGLPCDASWHDALLKLNLDNAWTFIIDNAEELQYDGRNVSKGSFDLDKSFEEILADDAGIKQRKGAFHYLMCAFNETAKLVAEVNNEKRHAGQSQNCRFWGIPLGKIRAFFHDMNFYDFYSTILKLSDMGGAVTQVTYPRPLGGHKAIGTSLCLGEVASESVDLLEPGLAWMITYMSDNGINNDLVKHIAIDYAKKNCDTMNIPPDKVERLLYKHFPSSIPQGTLYYDEICELKENDCLHSKFFMDLAILSDMYFIDNPNEPLDSHEKFKKYAASIWDSDNTVCPDAVKFLLTEEG